MLLQNLEISNFRAFKSVQLNDLGRVNLLVGKNNCGKTSVLEALRVFAGNGSLQSLLELAAERDDTGPQGFLEEQGVLKALFAGLFRDFDFQNNNQIVIGDTTNDKKVTIEHAWYVSIGNEDIKNPSEAEIDKAIKSQLFDYWEQIDITNLDGQARKFRFDRDIKSNMILNGFKVERKPISLSVVHSQGNYTHVFPSLWDRVSLYEAKKEQVINALNLIDLKIKTLAFIEVEGVSDEIAKLLIDNKNIAVKKRMPFVRLEGLDLSVPLKSMGDGVHRILDIVLHAVSAENGILLIDEFENGLHYAVQEKLWGLIFKIATELSVQVFVTTHSADCVRAFSHAAREHPEKGALIHMKKDEDTGDIQAITIDEDALENLLAADIEVR